MSDIHDYIKYQVEKHRELFTNSSIHIYINSINNRLVFKIKDGYKLELQMPEAMKLSGFTKKLTGKTKNGENVPSLEVFEGVLVQCNLADNQYRQKVDVLYIFPPNKSYAYLSNVEPSNLVFLKTYNTEFDEIIITFTDQSERLLVNRLLINRNDTLLYRTKNKKICQMIWIFVIREKSI